MNTLRKIFSKRVVYWFPKSVMEQMKAWEDFTKQREMDLMWGSSTGIDWLIPANTKKPLLRRIFQKHATQNFFQTSPTTWTMATTTTYSNIY